MAKINIPAKEWPDIIISFLYDKMLHPDEIVPGNKEFDRIMSKFKTKGILVELRDYYLNMNKSNRMKYKQIKKGLDDKATTSTVISIQPENIEKSARQKNKSLLKTLGKQMLKKIVASNEFSDAEKQLLREVIDNHE